MTEQDTTQLAQVGVIGMGVMGTNLARNMARHGYRVAIWNLEPERTFDVAKEFAEEGTFIPCRELSEFVAALETPRRIFMMVTAGKAVDAVNENLLKAGVQPGDVIADGGNSFFQDTRRRESELKEHGVHFFGVGISGGEVGALEGPSIMPGGSPEGYAAFGPILEDIAARASDGESCCAYMGADGAGHYVKMIHNGIEYADIEFIAESYALMQAAGLSQQEMVDVFRGWNAGELESYLIEIAGEVLAQTDAKTGGPLVDSIVDQASQKGTGMWTGQQALELGVPSNAIAEAVFARALSSHTDLRKAAQAALKGPEQKLDVDREVFLEDLRKALFCSKLVAYAQGLDQIRVAAQTYGWEVDIAKVARIWRAGCVIRAEILGWISDEYAKGDQVSLLASPSVAAKINEYQGAWRSVVAQAMLAGVPVLGFSSALGYFDAARTPRLSAAMVQGLRDYFGAHTYLRIDGGDMPFHTRWSEDHAEVEVPTVKKKAEQAQPQK